MANASLIKYVVANCNELLPELAVEGRSLIFKLRLPEKVDANRNEDYP